MENLSKKEAVLRDGFAETELQAYVSYLTDKEKMDYFQTKLVDYAKNHGVTITKEEARAYADEQLEFAKRHADLMSRYYKAGRSVEKADRREILSTYYSQADARGFVLFFSGKERRNYLVGKILELSKENGDDFTMQEVADFVEEELEALKEIAARDSI